MHMGGWAVPVYGSPPVGTLGYDPQLYASSSFIMHSMDFGPGPSGNNDHEPIEAMGLGDTNEITVITDHDVSAFLTEQPKNVWRTARALCTA